MVGSGKVKDEINPKHLSAIFFFNFGKPLAALVKDIKELSCTYLRGEIKV